MSQTFSSMIQVLVWTLKHFLIAEIISPVHTGHRKLSSEGLLGVSEGGENPSSFCEKIHSKFS